MIDSMRTIFEKYDLNRDSIIDDQLRINEVFKNLKK